MTKVLVIGGPYDGENIHWTGDLVEYPHCRYWRKTISAGQDTLTVYVLEGITDKQMLDMIRTNYGINTI